MPDNTQFDRLCVILVHPRNPLNIGAVARAMSNFGFRDLRVVDPYDPAFREARSAVGAADLLAHAQVHRSVGTAVADCTLVVGTTAVGHRDLQQPLHSLEAAGSMIRTVLGHKGQQDARVALLFGSEKFGLSNESLSYCNWILRIPTRDEHSSMNLAQAVAVCLYELVRAAKDIPPVLAVEASTAGKLELLAASLQKALNASGYANSHPGSATEETVRRLILRLHPVARDTETLLGMLRKILWKLRAEDSTEN